VSAKETADAADAWFNILLKLTGLAALILIVFFPHSAPILSRFVVKSSQINILGQQIQVVDTALIGKSVQLTDDGKLLVSGVDVNDMADFSAKLQQSIKDLKDQNSDLAQKVESQTALLSEATQQRDEANRRLVALSATAPLAKPVATAELDTSIDKAKQEIQLQIDAANATAQQASKLVKLGDAVPGVGFGLVFSGDSSPAAAMDEVNKATRPPISAIPVFIYKRLGSWRSVAYYGTRAEAAKQLPAFKANWPTAYVVDIASWCPTPTRISLETKEMAELKDCGF